MNILKDESNKASKSKTTVAEQAKQRIGLSIACLLSLLIALALPINANAQPVQALNSLLKWGQPYQSAPAGTPPPPGSGSIPYAVNPGDKNRGSGDSVATGVATTGTGNTFPTIQNANRTTVYVYVPTYEPIYSGPGGSGGQASDVPTYNTGNLTRPNYRGRRMVMTIRPDTLTNTQINDINEILNIDMLSGDESIIAVAPSMDTIEQINEILYPDASQQRWGISTLQGDGRLKITKDPTEAQWAQLRRPLDSNIITKFEPFELPIVLPFCRFFVIIGVVVGTVLVAQSAYSIIMGHQYAGTRAIASVVGLMTLLSAFTIYKIVLYHELKYTSAILTRNAAPQLMFGSGGVANPTTALPNVPIVPTVPTGRAARAGIPVIPLSQN